MAFLRWSRSARVVLVALTSTYLLYHKVLPSVFTRSRAYYTWSLDNYPRPKHGGTNDDICHAFRLRVAQQVQIVLKTGAADYDNLLTHLSTVTSCVSPSDLLIVSDLEDKIGLWQLHDTLASIPQDYKLHNRDFEIYFKQYKWREKSQSLSDIPNYDGGWKLDKYKFLPMMDYALRARPSKQWYLFIETDTYVDWENLFFWISHFDASQPLYMGSPVWPKNKVVFAHGGSGFVLSRTALEKLAEATHAANGSLAASMGIDLAQECCGDEILANVLHKLGIELRGYWPMFNGEKPATLRFGEEQWCEPMIALHHLNQAELKRFYLWQQQSKKITHVSCPFYMSHFAHPRHYILRVNKAGCSDRYSTKISMSMCGWKSLLRTPSGTIWPKIPGSTFVLISRILIMRSTARQAGTIPQQPNSAFPLAWLMLAVCNGVCARPIVG